MGKLKKTLRKKVNPEKSNKMIYAVVAGLLLIFAAIFFLSTGKKAPENKKGIMEDTLSYLKKTAGISEMIMEPEKNIIKLFYIQDSRETKQTDYKRITLFAGMKLSNKLKNEKFIFRLIDGLKRDPHLVIVFQNGKVVEKLLEK
ncbi:MAG: hypothetical protein ABFR75_08835 [Acidobacteriota bacterium]